MSLRVHHNQRGFFSIPKPTKSKRPNELRKKEIIKNDRKWGKEGKGICEACGIHPAEDPHHLVARRFSSTRHLPENRLYCCRRIHSGIQKYPEQTVLNMPKQKEVIEKIRNLSKLLEQEGLSAEVAYLRGIYPKIIFPEG